jgi:ABC-type dipeptide/oligopeptide/nickel transport system ATPase component
VGESGCGKSVTSLSIMRLISQPGRIVDGRILFDNEDLVALPESRMVNIRGNRVSMIFQQPQSSLNPVFRVGDQLAEVLQIHQDVGKEVGEKRAIELLAMVGVPDPESRAKAFPHELSGGMAQRVMIAMALACVPESAHRRRADDRPRRDHPGPDSGPDAQSAHQDGHGHHSHHPRSGCGGRDVRPG